ncbi:MAG: HPr family phosphocarrier protein [Thermoguttaceae bacterium]|jgi:phosphotransferase system HPr (HPr) family protein
MMSESAASRTVIVTNRAGLHARAAVLLAKAAGGFDARVLVSKGPQQVDATDVLQLMSLVAEQGDSLQLEASGPEARQAVDALEDLFLRKFDED